MNDSTDTHIQELEVREWIESLDYVRHDGGDERVQSLLHRLQQHAQEIGVKLPFTARTAYVNTIHVSDQVPYPGDREMERRIKSIVRWNALAMVQRANIGSKGIGGHISTYQSAATLYEVAFNHFFRGKDHPCGGDFVFFQGHASPGVYARAWMEGRLPIEKLNNFRKELARGGGLSSYPHPWLMEDFWEVPSVSMGLGPIMAIYQARFNRYLEDRGLRQPTDAKVWAFLGDGETDEPESLGAITLASREKLDNLIFVVNCNLQRLDGPVRGNGKIIQELEAAFRGAGWNVIKVVWGTDWDDLLARDDDHVLVQRMGEVVDGWFQKYVTSSGEFVREHFFGADERLRKLVAHLSDDQVKKLRRGGHDPEKVYNAFKAATEHSGQPTVVLAHTVKGYGLGAAGAGLNTTHQKKTLEPEDLVEFRDRFGLPISDSEVASAPFYKPDENSDEIRYLKERRQALGGFVPQRRVQCPTLPAPTDDELAEFYEGTAGREASTTMVFVRILAKLLKHPELGRHIVPIVPDEARTFGMEGLFRQCGIYSHVGQLYEPVDADSLLYYKEATDGQILEEGITEAGGTSSMIAAGTAYATHGIPMIPFFIFYSMFGMQRVGDLVWAGADMRTRGFLMGATAGRTTLNGEGLQHQDGQSHLYAYPVPNLVSYDPAFAYELAVIIQDGIRRMYVEQESVFYYLTLENENYAHPPMPEGCREGILKGVYRFKTGNIDPRAGKNGQPVRANLLGSGPIFGQVLKSQEILEERYGVRTDVWSVTSYKELHRDALEAERWSTLHPAQEARVPYVAQALGTADGAVNVAASDYVKALPASIARWVPGGLHCLGTDGFGRSETREALRDFFEVDWRFITLATLSQLARAGRIDPTVVEAAMKDLKIDPEKRDPLHA